MADVFISYSKSRRHLTSALAKDLNDAGFSVWWDTSLLPNQSFRTEIDTQLDASRVVIIIWSPESIRSHWVLAEADHALAQGKLVNTFASTLNPTEIPKPFNQTHAVPLNDLPAIIAAIEALSGVQRQSSWRPRRAVKRRNIIIIISAATMMAASSILLIKSTPKTMAPVWDMPRSTFVGERALLKWKHDTKFADSDTAESVHPSSFFQLESADNEAFLNPTRHAEIVNGEYTYVSGLNSSRYWRVRSANPHEPLTTSPWSAVTKVSQYDSARTRIKMTEKALILISNSEYQDIFKWIDSNGQFRGLDLVVVKAVVERLSTKIGVARQLKPEISTVPWSNILDAPRLGRADFIVSAISRRKTREGTFGLIFSTPYFCTGQSLLYRASRSGHKIEELISGASVGYQRNTTSEQLVTALSDKSRLSIKGVPFERTDFVVDALLSSRIEVAVVDTPFAIDSASPIQANRNGLSFTEFHATDFPISLPLDIRTDEYAIGMRGGENLLSDEVNEIMQSLITSGELAKLFSAELDDFMRIKGIQLHPLIEGKARTKPWDCPN